MMALVLTVETKKDLAEQVGVPTVTFDPVAWKAYTADGTRLNSLSSVRTYSCVNEQSTLLPTNIGPGEKVTGMVLLDAPSWPRNIAFSLPTQEDGWEWEVPAK